MKSRFHLSWFCCVHTSGSEILNILHGFMFLSCVYKDFTHWQFKSLFFQFQSCANTRNAQNKDGKQRREIISASTSDITSLLRGPPGPPVSTTLFISKCKILI